jgi:2-methylcitrate dehydratase PrpD
LAQKGITGPKNFMEGIYGYFHLYGKDKSDKESLLDGLGKRFEMGKTLFKKYPSCGCTLSSTDAILDLLKEKAINPEKISYIEVKVSPYCYKLVGHPFEIGENPKVNAQFSIQYCVANALLRRSSKLSHFDEPYIKDPRIEELIKKIHVFSDQSLDDPQKSGFSISSYLKVKTQNGKVYDKMVNIPRGLPGNPLSKEEHLERFYDCLNYSRINFKKRVIEKIISTVNRLEEAKDARKLILLLNTIKK